MNEMAVCGCSMKVDWNYKNKNLLKTGLLLLLYVVGIYLLITKMILLEKSGSGAGKPETGRTSDVSRGKENEKALQYGRTERAECERNIFPDRRECKKGSGAGKA